MSRDYYLANRNSLISQAKARYWQNRNDIREYWKNIPEERKERRRQYRREWAKRNHERKSAYDRQCFRTLRQNPTWRIRFNLAGRLGRFVRMRFADFQKVVGCDAATLRKYLESQFLAGMDWSNYGKGWHIDHIVPCSAFDLCDPAQARVCFNWQNLRPLWAKENLRKGKKITQPQMHLPLVLG